MNDLLVDVKAAGQDYEWYPTTRQMVQTIHSNMDPRYTKIMDVGAGNGSFFTLLQELDPDKHYEKFAIEKSQLLINAMPADVFVVGTEFHQQSFVDKTMDTIFCNPPYTEYAEWAEKLILEANCPCIYLIIPDRWKSHQGISSAIQKRDGTVFNLGNFSFMDSEFRKARANVDILRISLGSMNYRANQLKVDPFDLWFDTHFKIKADKQPVPGYTQQASASSRLKALVDKDIIKNLTQNYSQDFEILLNNYKAVEVLDNIILKELGVNVEGLKKGLREKIVGLKNIYWQELFNRLDAIIRRLTSKSREKLLTKLRENTSVDFTLSNIYSVVIWAVKNANKYFDQQVLDLYDEFTKYENIINYVSNSHLVEKPSRYETCWNFKARASHYKLDYRIVNEGFRAIGGSSWDSYQYPGGLYQDVHTLLSDVKAVGINLGFNVVGDSTKLEWVSGKKQIFKHDDKVFMEVKAHKNGNMHFKFDMDFMQKLNVEAGRLKGWLRTPREAAVELNLEIAKAQKYFKSNAQLLGSNVHLLSDCTEI